MKAMDNFIAISGSLDKLAFHSSDFSEAKPCSRTNMLGEDAM